MTDQTYPPEIVTAISAVMSEVDYVQKKGENKFHGYKFAAVGDILAKLQPSMAKHGLVVIQNEAGHQLDAGIMTAKYEFILAHKSGAVLPDRFVHTGVAAATNTKGGFDDKCLNKCMTAARKYFLLSLFQIPTGDLPDADQEEDKPAAAAPRPAQPAPRPQERAPLTPPAAVVPPNGDKNADPAVTWYRQRLTELEKAHGDKPMVPDQLEAWKKKHWSGIERLREQKHDDMAQHLTDLYNELWQKPACAA